MRERLVKLIDQVAVACIPWIRERDGIVQFVDPLDNEEISAHYGATHAAVALIVYGNSVNNQELVRKGESLLFSVLDRWNKTKQLPGFHNDFNNFALCVLDYYTEDYHDKIKKVVLETLDSNHDTVNWLPMRWFVNKRRYCWTGEKKYKGICNVCVKKIKKATYNDGFIDDRLPLGISFNLQYDVATVAIMQFLRIAGESIDVSKETGALLNAVCPDGDINYLGRGTNQIFAWGLWIYLLASGSLDELDRALTYLEDRLPTMLKNHNLMLNEYPGEEKYMWWDYHYCSVYTAHLLLWLILAWKDWDKDKIDPMLVNDGSSGVHIYKNDAVFIATFDGRSEYLAERGPVIAAMWTKNSGVVCKGTFGPWPGAFGSKYWLPNETLHNYTGLSVFETGRNWSKNRIVKKLLPLVKARTCERFEPLFTGIDINLEVDSVSVVIKEVKKNCFVHMTMPVDQSMDSIIIRKNSFSLMLSMKIRNQYGWNNIFHSIKPVDSVIEFSIK